MHIKRGDFFEAADYWLRRKLEKHTVDPEVSNNFPDQEYDSYERNGELDPVWRLNHEFEYICNMASFVQRHDEIKYLAQAFENARTNAPKGGFANLYGAILDIFRFYH